MKNKQTKKYSNKYIGGEGSFFKSNLVIYFQLFTTSGFTIFIFLQLLMIHDCTSFYDYLTLKIKTDLNKMY